MTPVAGPQRPPWMPHDIRDGVAVVATSFWTAHKARELLEIEWDEGPNAGLSTADFEIIAQEHAIHRTDPTGFIGDENAVADLSKVRKTLRASYVYPHQLHSCMEPLNCTAFVTADECEIWCGSQVPNLISNAVKDLLKLPAEKVKVHLMPSGGGFGRRAYPDMAVEAAFISREAGNVPVKMLWTREDDQTCNLVHLFQHMEYQAALDGQGKLYAWYEKELKTYNWSQPTIDPSLSAMAYDIPNIRYDLEDIIALRTGALVRLARRGRARQGAERMFHRRDCGRAQTRSAGVSSVDAEARPRRLRRSQPDALQRPHATRAAAGGGQGRLGAEACAGARARHLPESLWQYLRRVHRGDHREGRQPQDRPGDGRRRLRAVGESLQRREPDRRRHRLGSHRTALWRSAYPERTPRAHQLPPEQAA